MRELLTGEACEPCSSHVNASFIFAKQIYHPSGRPCIHVEPPPGSNAPSEEVWRRYAESQRRAIQQEAAAVATVTRLARQQSPAPEANQNGSATAASGNPTPPCSPSQ